MRPRRRTVLRGLLAVRATDYEEISVQITSSWGFILRHVFYTVPSRLIDTASAYASTTRPACEAGVPSSWHRCIRNDPLAINEIYVGLDVRQNERILVVQEESAMQINPGGRLDTKDVMGRDNEIARYWGVLERQGLVISAERRIGKTHIVLKMRDECPSGYLPFYQDLEAVHSIADLIRSIYITVQEHCNTSPRLKAFIAKWSVLIPSKIGSVDLPTAEATWKVLLADAFDDLIASGDERIVLMLWDEFPLMLHNLQRREGDDAAMQLLDHLRALRLIRADRLRFLFTGSIGLHLVLRSLRKAGNTNDPVNDMHSLTVSPMAYPDTCDLAAALLTETRADPAQIPGLASQIASEVGGFPYYVHHVVDQLDQLRRPPEPQDVSSAVDSLVYDSHDPANLQYYVNRLSSYYAEEERSLALIVLDTMAGQSSPTPVPKLLNLCKHRDPSLGDEQLREVLTVLTEDHYIELKKGAGGAAYEFRWQLVKKWWKERRP